MAVQEYLFQFEYCREANRKNAGVFNIHTFGRSVSDEYNDAITDEFVSATCVRHPHFCESWLGRSIVPRYVHAVDKIIRLFRILDTRNCEVKETTLPAMVDYRLQDNQQVLECFLRVTTMFASPSELSFPLSNVLRVRTSDRLQHVAFWPLYASFCKRHEFY